MDGSELFSSAALQLLARIDDHPLDALMDPDVDIFDDVFGRCGAEDVLAAPSSRVKRKTDDANLALPGCSVFSFGPLPDERRKRSKFDMKRREEVSSVRKQGACFRCRVTKCPCSGTRPCKNCTHDQIPTQHQAPKHQWMSCIPFSLRGVDIYAMEFSCNETEYQKILNDLTNIIGEDVILCFDVPVQWDLNALALDFADWISNSSTDSSPPTSRVGILSSQYFKQLVYGLVSDGLSMNFKVFIELSSIIYNHGYKILSVEDGSLDLWRLQHLAGSRFLRGLEVVLSPKSLAKAPAEKLRALFLLLVGAIIAVSYTKRWTRTIIQRGSAQLLAENYEPTQRQLIHILTHHMVFLAERLLILDKNTPKEFLVEAAYRRWNKNALFEWRPMSYYNRNTTPRLASPKFPIVPARPNQENSNPNPDRIQPIVSHQGKSLWAGKSKCTYTCIVCYQYVHSDTSQPPYCARCPHFGHESSPPYPTLISLNQESQATGNETYYHDQQTQPPQHCPSLACTKLLNWDEICEMSHASLEGENNETLTSSEMAHTKLLPKECSAQALHQPMKPQYPSKKRRSYQTRSSIVCAFSSFKDLFKTRKHCCMACGVRLGKEKKCICCSSSNGNYRQVSHLTNYSSDDVLPISTDSESLSWSDWLADDAFENENSLGSSASAQSPYDQFFPTHSCQPACSGREMDFNLLV